jgi:hypothetical protein
MNSQIQLGSILIEGRPTMARTLDREIEPTHEAKHFLGTPYTPASAQPSSRLDNIPRRQMEQREAEWAHG